MHLQRADGVIAPERARLLRHFNCLAGPARVRLIQLIQQRQLQFFTVLPPALQPCSSHSAGDHFTARPIDGAAPAARL
jgi:hypothetical protein